MPVSAISPTEDLGFGIRDQGPGVNGLKSKFISVEYEDPILIQDTQSHALLVFPNIVPDLS